MRLSPCFIPVILGLTMTVPAVAPASAQVAVGISVNFAPPPIPVYVQPPIPAEGYLWTPGYWAYDEVTGYYWVPGTWVRPPAVGLLWTPPYWGFEGGIYGFHAGYWGPHIGFYGGVNYGFGYGGVGFEGGHWDGDHFAYNRSVTNISNTHITNVYNKRVVNSRPGGAAFNGAGGVQTRPTPAEEAAAKEPHQERTVAQNQHFEAAKNNPVLRASANHGKPAIAATARPGEFKGKGVVAAKVAGPGAARSAANHKAQQHAAAHASGTAVGRRAHAHVGAGTAEVGRQAAHPSSKGRPAAREGSGGVERPAVHHEARAPATKRGMPQHTAEHAAHPPARHTQPAHAAPQPKRAEDNRHS